jgi:CubicO group peptidase (beta-lactamase class C family)
MPHLINKSLYTIIFIIFSGMTIQSQFHKELKNLARENNLIGVSVAIVQNGELKKLYHYGLANPERKIKINDKTMFRVASISKTVTATAIMMLYDKGLFKLDDDISNYLGYKVINPNYPEKSITFRMLLSHTSGLRDSEAYDNFLMTSYKKDPPPPLRELLVEGGTFYQPDLFADQAPGSYFSYCNLNYAIIGTLVEKISGQRFDLFVKSQILDPLQIKGGFNTAEIEDIKYLSPLYRNAKPTVDDFKGIKPITRNLSGLQPGDNGIVYGPQGGFRVSAKGLCSFMLMLMNQGEYKGIRILKPETIELMHSTQWKFNGGNGDNYQGMFNEWGLGFHLITNTSGKDVILKDVPMIGHSGDAYGLISNMYFDKKTRFGFIFITNGYSGENGYKTGENSAFYKPEADFFKLLEKYFWKPDRKN